MEPADVPTTTLADRGSQPVTSARAASTPAWNAPPATPPAPSTSPTRGACTMAATVPGSGLLQDAQPLDGVEVLLHQALDDGGGLLDRVELTDDLADGIELHRLGLVGVAVAASHAVARHHVLHRHRQGVGRVRTVPRLGPLALEHPARLAGERAGPHRVARPGVQELLLLGRREVGLLHRQPEGAG